MAATFTLMKPADLAAGMIAVMPDPDGFTVPKNTPRYTVAGVELLQGEQARVTFEEVDAPVWEGHMDAALWAR